MTDDDDDGAFVASLIIIIPQLINTFRYYSSVPRYVDPSTTNREIHILVNAARFHIA